MSNPNRAVVEDAISPTTLIFELKGNHAALEAAAHAAASSTEEMRGIAGDLAAYRQGHTPEALAVLQGTLAQHGLPPWKDGATGPALAIVRRALVPRPRDPHAKRTIEHRCPDGEIVLACTRPQLADSPEEIAQQEAALLASLKRALLP